MHTRSKRPLEWRSRHPLYWEGGRLLTLALLLGLIHLEGQESPAREALGTPAAVVPIEQEGMPITDGQPHPLPPPRPRLPVERPQTKLLPIDAIKVLPLPERQRETDPHTITPNTAFVCYFEQGPTLQGGLAKLQGLVQYPEALQQAGIEGRVWVRFIVNTQGAVQDPRIVRSLHSDLDAEALRVVRLARFEPGIQRGNPVPVQLTLPITFRQNSP